MQIMSERLSKNEIKVDVHHQKITKADDFVNYLAKLRDEFNLK